MTEANDRQLLKAYARALLDRTEAARGACILYGTEHENPDDCTTHDHEGEPATHHALECCPLHVAAPALLAAATMAEDALSTLADAAGYDDFWNEDGDGYEAFIALRAAIAEARGS